MSKIFRTIAAVVIAILAIGGLAACSSSDKVSMDGVNSVIDVRTAGEYAAGHLQGAINIDVEATTFADQVQTLDKSGKYLVYCHSGRRAGIAVDNMKSLGFSDATNIGGIDEASAATSLPIVQ
jgi:rhodanese-related sulfurtransferase